MSKEKKHNASELPDRGQVADEYRILVGHYRTDGTFKTDEQLRVDYLHRADKLIHQMTHGVEVTNPETHERSQEVPDVVIFLDKSARPLAWLVRGLWDRLALTDDGEIAKQPDMRFLNIDRKQWANELDPQGNGILNLDRLDSSIIRGLRSVFVSPNHKEDGLTEKIDSAPASLDGKVVLVVDEVHSTGRTLSMATGMLSRAFPTAKIAGAYWMAGVATNGLAVGNADLPVWYKKKDPTGRGVNDRMKQPSGTEFSNITQRLGAWFLSTRFDQPDADSLQLRRELHRLANDTAVPVRLSIDRYDLSDDEGYRRYAAHTEAVNFGKTVDDTHARLRQIRAQKE